MAKVAASFAQAAPAEARFLYLHASALRQLDREKEAMELEKQALALNPDAEGPHFVAGDMLMDLGLDDLSVIEWKAILKINPADDVYDINAYMRLGQIAVRAHRNEAAADYYEKGLDLFRGKKAGGNSGYGIVGMSEDGIAALIKKLRQEGGADNDIVAAGARGKQLKLHIKSVVKDGKEKELLKALKSGGSSLSLRTQPLGIRLLDLDVCRVTYDRKTETILLLLNGSAACKPQRCVLGKKTKVVVAELDCVHVFEVDPVSSEITKLARFEKDYEVKVVPDESLRGYKGVDVKIGEKVYPWKDLLEGTKVDYLPEVLELQMEGPAAEGAPADTLHFRVPISENMLETERDSQ